MCHLVCFPSQCFCVSFLLLLICYNNRNQITKPVRAPSSSPRKRTPKAALSPTRKSDRKRNKPASYDPAALDRLDFGGRIRRQKIKRKKRMQKAPPKELTADQKAKLDKAGEWIDGKVIFFSP